MASRGGQCLLFFVLAVSVLAVPSACNLFNSGDQYAWNYPAAIESGGVSIQIGRLLIAQKTAFNDEFLREPYYQDKPVVVEIIFIVKNNSGQIMNVFPDQGYITVGGEQVDLYSTPSIIGDYVGGEILPGITKIGGFWFGFRRTTLDEIQSMDILIAAPFDSAYNTTGSEYYFQIDLSKRKNEPMPDELK
jgi:hypothetical protein